MEAVYSFIEARATLTVYSIPITFCFPLSVPADRMETMADDWLEVILRCPVLSL
jgi:hypothetical protein